MPERYWKAQEWNSATNHTHRNLRRDSDVYMREIWESCSLVSVTRFREDARRILSDESELSNRTLDNADYRVILDYFRDLCDLDELEEYSFSVEPPESTDPTRYLVFVCDRTGTHRSCKTWRQHSVSDRIWVRHVAKQEAHCKAYELNESRERTGRILVYRFGEVIETADLTESGL